ncbi:CYGB protein, partial [Atractosteus spatula]|nr:CYGB protein [Atractosteus spatula]
MAVSAGDATAARAIWGKLYASAEDNGTAALVKMFINSPDTKSYFGHFSGMGSAADMEASPQVRNHGRTVFGALNEMMSQVESDAGLSAIISPLATKHATQLKVDSKNFRVSVRLRAATHSHPTGY